MAASSSVCLMSKATSTKSWLWHHRLSHLNFGTVNDLTRLDLVDGLPKFKYGKDHICSAYERGKSKKASHPLKSVPNETPEIIKKFIAQAQLNYKVKVCKIRTNNGTKFKNATLRAHYEKIMEKLPVKFDEITTMASEHDCLEPELQRFINHNSSAETMNTPSKEDLDNLFGPMYEEYFEKKFSDTPINFAAQLTQIHENSPSTSSIIDDEHEAPPIVTTSDEQTSPISLTEVDEFNQEYSANFDDNSQFVSYNPP
ncbi:integrase, catalytic region, zinc finger, CCHC-type containing protein [Tanacetum coccineum]